MIPLVRLTTTAGETLHLHPDRITAVGGYELAARPTISQPSAFPGLPATVTYGSEASRQTYVAVGDGAGTFSVVESADEVIARRDAAYRRRMGRIFRLPRRVRAAA